MKEIFNKPDLIDKMAESQNITKIKAKEVIELFTSTVFDVLAAGDELKLAGFGTFKLIDVKEKVYRHPATGELAKAAAFKKIKFIPSTALTNMINE